MSRPRLNFMEIFAVQRPRRAKTPAEMRATELLDRELAEVFSSSLGGVAPPRNLKRVIYGEGNPSAHLDDRLIELARAGGSEQQLMLVVAAFVRFARRLKNPELMREPWSVAS